MRPSALHTIGCLLFDGVRAFDYAVVCEVWSNRAAGFDLRVCGPGGARVRLGGGLERVPDAGLEGLADCDLVLVPGVEDPLAPVDPAVLAVLRAVHERGTPLASLCAGAFVLAEAGLLDGRTATTHWALADQLARRYPAVDVRPEVLFTGGGPDGRTSGGPHGKTRSGPHGGAKGASESSPYGAIWTSAGVAAGIDLCLHLVRTARGQREAAAIARAMVTAPFRTGGQAQFIPSPVPAPTGAEDPLSRARTQVLGALGEPWTVRTMARAALMSERSFARRFAEATGTTPLRWLLEQRLLAAQRLLEETDLPVNEVALRCGFSSAVALRPGFVRAVGVAPREYRRAFRGGAA